MEINFFKYQGTGNDFIIVDNRTNFFDQSPELIQKMCDRKFGIGSDGLILIEKDDQYNSDFSMNFYNPDASQSFCGNGSRAAIAFCVEHLNFKREHLNFLAIDGLHQGDYSTDHSGFGYVKIKMNDVGSIDQINEDYYLNTGSPHYVRMVENVNEYNLINFGREIRYHERFNHQNGTNVNIVEAVNSNEFKMRTYERGVEDETLSCGTGVTACSLVYGQIHGSNEINVNTKGGQLKVLFKYSNDGFSNIWLCGPAKQVFNGIFKQA